MRDRYSAFRRLMAVWLQHGTFLKLLCRERDEQRWLFSCFFIRTGSNAQTLSQNLSGPGEHSASSITGASSTGFSFDCGGPLQRPGPLSVHIRVPTPVIWLASTRMLLHHRCLSLSLSLSLFSSRPIYLYLSASPSLPSPPPSPLSLHHFSRL